MQYSRLNGHWQMLSNGTETEFIGNVLQLNQTGAIWIWIGERATGHDHGAFSAWYTFQLSSFMLFDAIACLHATHLKINLVSAIDLSSLLVSHLLNIVCAIWIWDHVWTQECCPGFFVVQWSTCSYRQSDGQINDKFHFDKRNGSISFATNGVQSTNDIFLRKIAAIYTNFHCSSIGTGSITLYCTVSILIEGCFEFLLIFAFSFFLLLFVVQWIKKKWEMSPIVLYGYWKHSTRIEWIRHKF